MVETGRPVYLLVIDGVGHPSRSGSQEWDAAATPGSPRPPAPLPLFPPSSAAARAENGAFHWERRFMWLPGASAIIRILEWHLSHEQSGPHPTNMRIIPVCLSARLIYYRRRRNIDSCLGGNGRT